MVGAGAEAGAVQKWAIFATLVPTLKRTFDTPTEVDRDFSKGGSKFLALP
jgi:hypothetical protein